MTEEKIRLGRIEKTSIKDFNIEEARGWTIDRLLQIESKIDSLIIEYFKPSERDLFKTVVLNSSIMDIGSKLKVLKNINAIDDKTIGKIRKLAAIRNGFAHAPITETVHIQIETNFNASNDSVKVDVETMIEVMNAQGEIKVKGAHSYLTEFLTLDKEIRDVF